MQSNNIIPDYHTVSDNKLLEFFLDVIHPAELWPGVNSASNRNGYQEYEYIL